MYIDGAHLHSKRGRRAWRVRCSVVCGVVCGGRARWDGWVHWPWGGVGLELQEWCGMVWWCGVVC